MKKDSLSRLSCSDCRKHTWVKEIHYVVHSIGGFLNIIIHTLRRTLISYQHQQRQDWAKKLFSKWLSAATQEKYYVNVSLEGESRTLSIKYKYGLQVWKFVLVFLFFLCGYRTFEERTWEKPWRRKRNLLHWFQLQRIGISLLSVFQDGQVILNF